MTLYRYEAVAASGELISGEIEAAGEDALVDRLQAEGHTPIRVESTAGAGQGRAAVRRRAGGARRSANLALLTQQLATLLHAGLSLDRALEVAQVAVGRK